MDYFESAPKEHQRKEKAKAYELKKSSWWKQQLGKGICYYCHNKFKPTELTMDHVIPIARGGKSTKNNCVPCCKPCNNKKSNKTTFELVFEELKTQKDAVISNAATVTNLDSEMEISMKEYDNTNFLKIAVTQFNSTNSVEINLKNILNIITEAFHENHKNDPQSPIDIIFFPENCLYFRIDENEKFNYIDFNDEIFDELKNISTETGIAIHLGSVALLHEGKKYNSCLLIDGNKKVQILYSKIHLFDVNVKNEKRSMESDFFDSGNTPAILNFKSWKIGQSICYDIRFSNLFLKYAQSEVDMITIPAAFLKTTGEKHWEILNRARAIESQCYIVSSAQGGIHKSSTSDQTRITFGHSLVIDPWGEKLLEVSGNEKVKIITLEKNKIETVRKQIPMKDHRKKIE